MTPAMAIPLRCRSVNRCRCCALRGQRKAQARALMGAEGALVALITLTVREDDPRFLDVRNRAGKARPGDPGISWVTRESARYASWAFNRFRTYLAREYGPAPYFAGRELTQRGVVHVHLAVRVADAVEFLRLRSLIRGHEATRREVASNDRAAGLAIRAGFGYVVDVQLGRQASAVARYVAKGDGPAVAAFASRGKAGELTTDGRRVAAYVSKGMVQALPRYTRRSSWSISPKSAWAPGWVKPARLGGFSWRLAPASVGVVARALEASGFVLVDPAEVRDVQSAGGAGGRDGPSWRN